MTSGNQSLNLLGKKVRLKMLKVKAQLPKSSLMKMNHLKYLLSMTNGEVPKVELGQIIEVRS